MVSVFHGNFLWVKWGLLKVLISLKKDRLGIFSHSHLSGIQKLLFNDPDSSYFKALHVASVPSTYCGLCHMYAATELPWSVLAHCVYWASLLSGKSCLQSSLFKILLKE